MRQMLVSWAVTSSFLILAVIALRAMLGKRMGAGLRYALWGLVLLRLLVPVQLFSSPVLGMVIDTERIETRQTVTEREVLDAIGGQDGPQVVVSAPPITPDSPDFPEAPKVPEMPAAPAVPDAPAAPDWRLLPAVLGWLWLAGGIAMALVLLGCNLRFYLHLRRTRRASSFSREKKKQKELHTFSQGNDCEPLPEAETLSVYAGNDLPFPVYVADGLPSPCLFGVFRPAVYVSPETAADPAALRHVLAHEGTHFRHGDHVWSLLRCAALCVHWWNPLVWLAVKLSRRDGELACDAGALKRLGDEERAAYGSTLLALVTAKATPGGLLTCSTAMNGDKKSLKERFARIARAPKRAVGIAAAAVLLAALVTVCAFGQKTEESREEKGDAPTETVAPSDSPDVEAGTETAAPSDSPDVQAQTQAPEGPAPAPVYVRDASENDMPSDQLVLVYQGREKPFEALWKHFSAGDICEGSVTDLNGDGRDEIVVILHEGSGTEATMSRPHIFDAETLEEYDTSWYWDGFDPYISSTGDEENFYLSVPGLNRITISKSGVTGEAADAISFGTWVEYELQDGRLVCSLEGFSRFDYVCGLRAVVELDLDPDTMSIEYSFRDFTFEPSEDFEPLPEPTAPSESPAASESPASDESEDPMASHFSGLMAASAAHSRPRRPAEDLADMTVLPYSPDLTGDGVPETLRRGLFYEHPDPTVDDTTRMGIGIWEGDELLWCSVNYDPSGANYNWAFLLLETETGPCILEYRNSFWKTSEGQIGCNLEYDVRGLTDGGYHSVAGDATGYYYGSAQAVTQYYDAQDIARFKDGADALLSRGKLLLDNSGIFAGKEQKVDLTWMEEFAVGFTWDDSASSLENLTRFKELSLDPPEPTPVTDAAQARTELKAALLGETDFTLWGSQGKPITADIDTAPPTAFDSLSVEWEKYNSFAVADLDGDGVEEVVYHVTDVAGDMGGHLILRWAGPGDLRCYSIRYSHLMELKADGSFWYSMMAGMGGLGGTVRLSFPAPGYVASMQYLTEYNVAFTPETPYKVNGEIASKEEYDAVQAKQDAKPDAVWYDFTPENVKKVLG